MPAVSSSPIAVLVRHLGPVGEVPTAARQSLLQALDSVPDPRHKRGVCHRFGAILFVSIYAVVAGARSFTAIAEWAADAVASTAQALPDVGISAPNATTIRRALSRAVGDDFDAVIGSWIAAQLAATPVAAGGTVWCRAVAVDGKTLRGSRCGDGRARHLMACLDHGSGVVLGQVDVDIKTNGGLTSV